MNSFKSTIEKFLLKMKDSSFKKSLKPNELSIGKIFFGTPKYIQDWDPFVSFGSSNLYLVHDPLYKEFTIRTNCRDSEMKYGVTVFKHDKGSNENLIDWVEDCLKILRGDCLDFEAFQNNHPTLHCRQIGFTIFEIEADGSTMSFEKLWSSKTGMASFIRTRFGDWEHFQSSSSFENVFKNALSNLPLERKMMLNSEVRDMI